MSPNNRHCLVIKISPDYCMHMMWVGTPDDREIHFQVSVSSNMFSHNLEGELSLQSEGLNQSGGYSLCVFEETDLAMSELCVFPSLSHSAWLRIQHLGSCTLWLRLHYRQSC